MRDRALAEANNEHTSEELHKFFLYEAVSGKLYWRVNRGQRVKAGDEAGSQHNKGYLAVEVEGVAYLVHRVIWCMIHGEWPEKFIDHEDLDKQNNRLHNLRQASRSGNNCNQAMRSDNTSGVKGVNWNTRQGKWIARVQVNGKRIQVGCFDSLEDAEKAVQDARSKQHKEFANHG